MLVDLPERLAKELDKIDFERVKESDLDLIIKIGIPLLKKKGYLKQTTKEVHNGKLLETSTSLSQT